MNLQKAQIWLSNRAQTGDNNNYNNSNNNNNNNKLTTTTTTTTTALKHLNKKYDTFQKLQVLLF